MEVLKNKELNKKSGSHTREKTRRWTNNRLGPIHNLCVPEKFAFARHMRHVPTEAEKTLGKALYARKMMGYRFHRQKVLFGWIADFWCPALRLVIEVDGSVHYQRREADARRDGVMVAKGIHVFRVTNIEVIENSAKTLKRLAAYITSIQSQCATPSWSGRIMPRPKSSQRTQRTRWEHGPWAEERWV